MPRRLSLSLIAAVILTLIAIYFALVGKNRAVEFAPVAMGNMEIDQQLDGPAPPMTGADSQVGGGEASGSGYEP